MVIMNGDDSEEVNKEKVDDYITGILELIVGTFITFFGGPFITLVFPLIVFIVFTMIIIFVVIIPFEFFGIWFDIVSLLIIIE